MKRFSILLAVALLTAPAALRAQDAALEERLNKLSAQIEDLIVAKDAQNKRIEELARSLRELQDQQNKPNGNYASQEDVKQLVAKLQEIDRKRQDDNEHILSVLDKLGKTVRTPPTAPRPSPPAADSGQTGTPIPQNGYTYVVKEKDTLNAIVKAYNDQGVKVTVKQVLAANPGLKPESLKIDQKIFIPSP